jgi:uncharacterized protein with PCYCGC motif
MRIDADTTPSADANISRRVAVSSLFRFAAAIAVLPRTLLRGSDPFPHPEPRPGVTAERVIPAEKLPNKSSVRAAYEAARQSPAIFDGLYCVCDCKESMGHRSLLECFESMQASGCMACEEQADLVAKMVKGGKTLDEIRAAIDRKWG